MSKGVYRDPRSPYWQIDVQFAGARLRRSARTTSRREAEGIVEAWKTKQRQALILGDDAPKKKADMTISEAAERYFQEKGAAAKTADDIDRDLDWLVNALGPDRLLTDIDEPLVLQIASERRGQGRRGNVKAWAPIAESSINREVIDPLRRVMRRASKSWKVAVADIDWEAVRTAEPKEGRFGRELTTNEEGAFFASLRPDLHDFVRFALAYGVRMGALCALEWRHVDLARRVIRVRRKTAKPGVHWQEVPLTTWGVATLTAQQGRHKRFVWTYVVHRRRGDARRVGERLALTWSVVRRQTDNARRTANLEDFRRHDVRHTCARRTLRASKNLKAIQRLLGHSDIATTAIYAEVIQDDIVEALEAAERAAAAAIAAHSPTFPGADQQKIDIAEEKQRRRRA